MQIVLYLGGWQPQTQKKCLNCRIWAFGRKMVKYLNARKTALNTSQLRWFPMNLKCPIMTLYMNILHHLRCNFCTFAKITENQGFSLLSKGPAAFNFRVGFFYLTFFFFKVWLTSRTTNRLLDFIKYRYSGYPYVTLESSSLKQLKKHNTFGEVWM